MHILVVSEGCYPFVTGGVSTWCDQLIRGLPEHRFTVAAVTARGGGRPVRELPANAEALVTYPIWDWARPARPLRGARGRRMLADVGLLLAALTDDRVPQHDFDEALRALVMSPWVDRLGAVLTSDAAAGLLRAGFHTGREGEISLADAHTALRLIEHSLRPAVAPAVEADLVHAVSNGLPMLVALKARWTHGMPIVMSEHGVYLRERYLAYGSLDLAWSVKSVVLEFFARLSRTGYAHADLITPVNVYNRRWELEHGADPARIRTVLNGVDPAGFAAAGPEPEVPTVVWVGRIDPLKDVETLVEGFAVARASLPTARLRLFGPVPKGNEAYAARVHELVRARGLTDAVVFEGPVSPVSRAYAAGSVVALTSISEGLPYTVIEAMMCGRVTVSTDVGGVSEVVGDAGLLVPARDPAALGAALAAILRDDVERARLGAAARERALAGFRLDTMLATFREAYAELCAPAPTYARIRELLARAARPSQPAGVPSQRVEGERVEGAVPVAAVLSAGVPGQRAGTARVPVASPR